MTSQLGPAPASFTFDEQRILNAETLEKKELFLFQWLSSLEKDLFKSNRDTIKPYQSDLEKNLLKILLLTDPRPNRPIRQIVARCFVIIYQNGDARSLFDTLSALQNYLGNKKLEDVFVKLALIHTIGCLSEHHGSKLLSLFPESINLFTKQLKAARDADIPIRYESLLSLARTLRGAGRAATEPMIKELLKYARNGLNDKYIIIKSASAQLFEAIYRHTSQTPPLKLDEYEYTLSLFLKPLEGSDYNLRRAIASAMASILAQSQNPAPIQKETVKRFSLFLGNSASAPQEDAVSINPDKKILTLEEMFSVFTTLLLKAEPKVVKIGILEAYASLLRQLGVEFLENNYSIVIKKLLELGTHPKMAASKNDALFMQHACRFLMRETVGKMLSELGQISAVNDLISGWVRRWPAVTGNEVPPSDATLVLVLDELAALLTDLGPAAASTQDLVIDPLAILLSHTSQTVNLSLAWCMRCLCTSLPDQLPRLIGKIVGLLQRDAGPSNSDKIENMDKIIGHGNVLASLVCVIPLRPLYISYESAAVVFGISTQLIKASSLNKDSALGAAQSLVAWTLVGALMTIGTNFVKVHLSQLLLIWKNCFPKPSPKDAGARTELEWNSLLINRYAALSALYSFLLYNRDLVTTDIAKRVAVFLNNTLSFVAALPISYAAASLPQGPTVPTDAFRMDLVNREALIKTRLLQCYAAIQPINYEMIGTQLLKFTIDQFLPDPERIDRWAASVYNPNEKTPVPEVKIGTTLVEGLSITVARDAGAEERGIGNALSYEMDVRPLEDLITQIYFGAVHYDPASLYLSKSGTHMQHRKPTPYLPAVALSNASIELFSIMFPLQPPSVQENTMETFLKHTKYTGTTVSSARMYSLQLNASVAIVGSLKYVMVKKGGLSSGKVPVAIQDLVEDQLSSQDTLLRAVSSETLGRLCRCVGSASFVNNLIQNMMDQIVNNREPHCRAGCSLALGTIGGYMGGMASGPHLKNIVGILHSLASDTHCLVHVWALHSLWLTIESAGLMYNQYVNSTLTLVTKLFMSETHEETAVQANLVDGDRNSDVLPAFGRILHALVGVLGPELQASPKVRDLFFSLYDQLKMDSDPFTVAEAIRCVQQFILFAPKLVDIESLVPFLQRQLAFDYQSQVHVMRKAAIHCLYQLSQKDAGSVLLASKDDKLEEQLFGLLDMEMDDAIQDEMKDILINFLKHVAAIKPTRWLTLCKSILSKGNSGTGNEKGAPIAAGRGAAPPASEDDGFTSPTDDREPDSELTSPQPPAPTNTASASKGTPIVLLLLPRWKTQLFALTCLRKVLLVASISGVKEHFDLGLARETSAALSDKEQTSDFLIFKLVEFIRVSFSTATANLYELKLEGLLLLKDILQKYSCVPDPDLEDHSLLEQYQAQITSALAPAFDEDSGAELVATASQVCAHYIGSGIHRDISTLSRLLRLMNNLLEFYSNSKGQESFANGKIILKVAVLSAWADIYLSSLQYRELKPIVDGNLLTLSKLWSSTLYDYAKLTLDGDVSAELPSNELNNAKNMDVYVAAVRQITLPFYQKSWTAILEALTTLVDQRSDIERIIFEEETDSAEPDSRAFHLLLGLCIEAISTMGTVGTSTSAAQGLESKSNSDALANQNLNKLMACLSGIGKLLKKAAAASPPLNKGVFVEVMTVFDRLMQTEGIQVQRLIIGIVQNVITSYPESYFLEENVDPIVRPEVITGSVDSTLGTTLDNSVCIQSTSKLYKCLKVVFNVFLYHIPGFANNPTSALSYSHPLTPDSTILIISSLQSLSKLVSLPGILAVHHKELLPLAFYIYTAVLGNEKFTVEIATKVLVLLKASLETAETASCMDGSCTSSETLKLMVGTLLDIAGIDEGDRSPDGSYPVKVKNALLALTLILTTSPLASFDSGNQEAFADTLLDYLKCSSQQYSLIAIQCIKSLLLLSVNADAKISYIGASYCRLILPGFLEELYVKSEDIKAGNAPNSLPVIEEMVKTLLLLQQAVLDPSKKQSVLAIVVTALMDLLVDIPESSSLPKFNSMADRQLFVLSTQSLMNLVSQNQTAFKDLVSSLPVETRTKLERALKSLPNVQDQSTGMKPKAESLRPEVNQGSNAASSQPKIQLKNFANFG